MNNKRVNIWFRSGPDVYLSNEAQQLVSRMGCAVRTFDLSTTDGKETTTVAIFPQESPVLALIDTSSPAWAEAAVARLFNSDGTKRADKWEEAA